MVTPRSFFYWSEARRTILKLLRKIACELFEVLKGNAILVVAMTLLPAFEANQSLACSASRVLAELPKGRPRYDCVAVNRGTPSYSALTFTYLVVFINFSKQILNAAITQLADVLHLEMLSAARLHTSNFYCIPVEHSNL